MIKNSINSSPIQVTNNFDFSHARINIGSHKIQRSNNEHVNLMSSSSQCALKEKTQSMDWVEIVEIITAVIMALQALITIVKPLFALLC